MIVDIIFQYMPLYSNDCGYSMIFQWYSGISSDEIPQTVWINIFSRRDPFIPAAAEPSWNPPGAVRPSPTPCTAKMEYWHSIGNSEYSNICHYMPLSSNDYDRLWKKHPGFAVHDWSINSRLDRPTNKKDHLRVKSGYGGGFCKISSAFHLSMA